MDIDYKINKGEPLHRILVEMRKETGWNRKELSDYFEIPYRTLQDWELNKRPIPMYILRMMEYQLRKEKYIKQI